MAGSPRRLLYVSRDEPALRRVVLQETRSLLLELLKRTRPDGKPGWTIQELSRKLGFTAQNIHHHLQVLREHGLARVAMEEETNGLARQYWTTDVEHVYTDMAPDAKAALAQDKAMGHHAAPGADDAYFRGHFAAMAELGAPVPQELQPEVVAFYRAESALFSAHFARLVPLLRDTASRHGVGASKSALHFAAIASMSEAEFEEWVRGLRLLRDSASRGVLAAPPMPLASTLLPAPAPDPADPARSEPAPANPAPERPTLKGSP